MFSIPWLQKQVPSMDIRMSTSTSRMRGCLAHYLVEEDAEQKENCLAVERQYIENSNWLISVSEEQMNRSRRSFHPLSNMK